MGSKVLDPNIVSQEPWGSVCSFRNQGLGVRCYGWGAFGIRNHGLGVRDEELVFTRGGQGVYFQGLTVSGCDCRVLSDATFWLCVIVRSRGAGARLV